MVILPRKREIILFLPLPILTLAASIRLLLLTARNSLSLGGTVTVLKPELAFKGFNPLDVFGSNHTYPLELNYREN